MQIALFNLDFSSSMTVLAFVSWFLFLSLEQWWCCCGHQQSLWYRKQAAVFLFVFTSQCVCICQWVFSACDRYGTSLTAVEKVTHPYRLYFSKIIFCKLENAILQTTVIRNVLASLLFLTQDHTCALLAHNSWHKTQSPWIFKKQGLYLT